MGSWVSGFMVGSSPRVRGRALGPLFLSGWCGIIPAGAGKRPQKVLDRPAREDHPRGCGEECHMKEGNLESLGSSPRVRGRGTARRPRAAPSRIIPAGAGKSMISAVPVLCRWDHPRGCGEEALLPCLIALPLGSSPRVRGRAARPRAGRRATGIIPAGAGKSFHVELVERGGGSSPRVRGRGRRGLRGRLLGGIIPAGAGKRCI